MLFPNSLFALGNFDVDVGVIPGFGDVAICCHFKAQAALQKGAFEALKVMSANIIQEQFCI